MKGQLVVPDFIYAWATIFAITLVAMVLVYAYLQYDAVFKTLGGAGGLPIDTPITNQSNATANSITTQLGNNLLNSDDLIVLVFGLIYVGIIIFAALLNSNPLGWGIGLFGIIFLVYIATIMTNVAFAVFSTNSLAAVVPYFPHTLVLFANFPLEAAVFGFIYCLVIAARVVFFNPNK